MRESTVRTDSRGLEFLLALGCLAVAAAVVIARSSPATGYEVSIYRATPILVWALLGGALLIATVVIVMRTSGNLTTIAMVLGGIVMMSIVAMPILRGYHFFGAADSLTHLGWTRDIASGAMDPHSLFYPGYHSLSLAVGRFTGISIRLALLVTTISLFAGFLVFVPLTAGLITGDLRAMGFGAIVSWFVLPINNIATHLLPHTNSLALFYIPVLLFSLVLFLRSSTDGDESILRIKSTGVMLSILSMGIVLFHIQHAVNVFLLFSGICVAQFITRRFYSRRWVETHQTMYFQTAILGLFATTWAFSHEIVAREASLTVQNLYREDIGATSTVAQRGGSLTAVGGSLSELFVKMFLVSAIIGAVAFVYFVLVRSDRLQVNRDIRKILLYFGIAFVPLVTLFGLYFLGKPKMSFRQLGFMYVLITILGAMAIARFSYWIDQGVSFGRPAIGAVLAVCLVLSVLTAFGSPFIYIATPDVSQQEIQGYNTALETRAEEFPLAALSSQASRYSDAKYGTAEGTTYDFVGSGTGKLNSSAINSGQPSQAYPDSEFHAAFSKRDVVKQTEVYEEINYQESGIRRFDTSYQSNRVLSNGEFNLYYVTREEIE